MQTSAPRDYSGLTGAVSKAEVAEFRRVSRATNRFPSGMRVTMVVSVAVALVVFAVLASVLSGVFLSLLSSVAGDGRGWPGFAPVVIVVGIVAVAGIVAVGSYIAASARWRRWLRQSQFAEANGLRFSPAGADPAYPGAIFQIGSSRSATDHFMAAEGRALDFGNYRYTTGSGKNQTTHRWGFLALGLDRNLPHMVLDAKSNNGLFGGTNLPAAFRKDQVLSLEGDFDAYFTLYCPREYERDALYVFTPDLMALLIDEAAAFDVEIVDQWLFVYSAAAFDMTDAATIERLLRIADTVGAKALSRMERYSDDRAGARDLTGPPLGATGIVAPRGRRLRTRIPIATLLLFGGFVVFYIFRFVLDGGG